MGNPWDTWPKSNIKEYYIDTWKTSGRDAVIKELKQRLDAKTSNHLNPHRIELLAIIEGTFVATIDDFTKQLNDLLGDTTPIYVSDTVGPAIPVQCKAKKKYPDDIPL